MKPRPRRGGRRLLGITLASVAAAPLLWAQTRQLGTIDFPTSGAPAAQAAFTRGVLLLYSFEYRDAMLAFREAEGIDPGFAMAYWGEALTYTHPVWNEQDQNAGRATLQRLGPTPRARRAKAPTAREQAYLGAAEILYDDGPKAKRDTAYSLAMARLVERFPADREAKVLYAFSLLGLSQGVRNVPTYMRAAAIAAQVFRDNPNHPGAVHVLIHCYDDPVHARLGLAAARAYAEIAPGAAHAHHMTTHIFLALGMWDDVVSQNEIAAGSDRAAWTPNHYTYWLGYGYLQQGRYADALRFLELLQQNTDPTLPRERAELAHLRADYVVNTERWDSPVREWRIDLADARFRDRAVDRFVAGFSALKRGDRAGAERELANLVALNRQAAVDAGRHGDPVPAIVLKELRAVLRQADGARDEAIRLGVEATILEDAMPLEFGPPAVVKPTHELLCEMLLEMHQPERAERECDRALRLTPKRALGLLGLGRAAAAASDAATAARAYAALRAIWHRADPDLPEAAEAARFPVTPPQRTAGPS